MPYYTVPKIGTGIQDDPYRPDIPVGTAFVGNEKGNVFLVFTPVELPAKVGRNKQLPRQAHENAAVDLGFVYDDVAKWYVRG